MTSTDGNPEITLRRNLSERRSSECQDEMQINNRKYLKSESVNDLVSIEELVTCSIHLGIMVLPRKLQCQHSFCTECLISIFKINETLICPICRYKENCTDVMTLPEALVEKQLIEVVMQKRVAQCSVKPFNEVLISQEEKAELLNHLLEEQNKEHSGIYKFDENVENLSKRKPNINMKSLPSSVCSSTYDVMDIEIIRENMLKYSCYEDVKNNSIRKILKHNLAKKHSETYPEFSSFDVHPLKDKANSFEIIFVDNKTNRIFVFSDSEFRSFYIYIEGVIVKPGYIRIIHHDIFVSGYICDRGITYFVFIQCNMYGKIIRKTDKFVYTESVSPLSIINGFDVDTKNEKYFLCMPHTNSIQVYNTALVECRQCYDFDNNHPEYVALHQSQNQIWISCPRNRKILIADLDTGTFMMFRTDQINQAIPKVIFCTDDERVIFLDSRSNRLFWIKRRGDYILTQKLHFRSVNGDLRIKTFQVLPFSLVLVATCNDFLVFQPVKSRSKLRYGLSTCAVL